MLSQEAQCLTSGRLKGKDQAWPVLLKFDCCSKSSVAKARKHENASKNKEERRLVLEKKKRREREALLGSQRSNAVLTLGGGSHGSRLGRRLEEAQMPRT